MANRRRQDSSRASWLARKSEKSIGRILVQRTPGERKSGMPHSVDMPAPVNGTMTSASPTSSRRRLTAVFRSGAIMGRKVHHLRGGNQNAGRGGTGQRVGGV